MMTKSIVGRAWAVDKGDLLNHLDPDTRKIMRVEKIRLKTINKVFHRI